jgi:phospholipid/cholesterol/gamma-HCH transport system permease protein
MLTPRRPFAWCEFLIQSYFLARVSLLPTLLLAPTHCTQTLN